MSVEYLISSYAILTVPEQLVERVEWAGVVGMGGGAFPTWEKIAAAFGKVDTLIVNVAECGGSRGAGRPS